QAPTQLRMPAAVTYVNCVGDCNGDNAVMIDELMLAVNIALGASDTGACLVSDRDASGTVQIDELGAAVDAALQEWGGWPIQQRYPACQLRHCVPAPGASGCSTPARDHHTVWWPRSCRRKAGVRHRRTFFASKDKPSVSPPTTIGCVGLPPRSKWTSIP